MSARLRFDLAMIRARYALALAGIRIRHRLELVRIWIRFAPVILPGRIRRRLWIRRRLIRNWYRSSFGPDQIEQQLDGLEDPGLIERMSY